jgi:hypothetical protein
MTMPAQAAEGEDGRNGPRGLMEMSGTFLQHVVDRAGARRYEFVAEGEGTDYEVMVSVPLLDHLPDWRRPLARLRRLLASR